MATRSDVSEVHATLSGSTQDVVTITGSAEAIEVVNRHATEDLWIAWGGSDPGSISVGGDGTKVVLARKAFGIRRAGVTPTVLRLLGNGNAYSVQAVSLGMGHEFAYTPYGANVAVADGGTGADDAATARTNLGVEIDTDVQAHAAALDDISAVTAVQGDLLAFDGTHWVAVAAGASGQVLTSNGAGTVPTWQNLP